MKYRTRVLVRISNFDPSVWWSRLSVSVSLAAALACAITRADASVIAATSGALADVQNAVLSAGNGDIVLMPPGTNAWSDKLVLNNGIVLKGAGIDRTVIIDEVQQVGNGSPMISITLEPFKVFDLSGFTIQGGTVNTAFNYRGAIRVSSLSHSWRIHDIKFDHVHGNAFIIYGNGYGVIDHCDFEMTAGTGIVAYDAAFGDASWATPVAWGTSEALYIEDNTFSNSGGAAAAYDGYAGARVVFRHNVVLNALFSFHGTESSQRYRGARSFEIYDNQFQDLSKAGYTAIHLRSGVGVIFNNTATGYRFLAKLVNYRNTDAFPPFGGATGFNPWDDNDPKLYLSGVHSGTNNSSVLYVQGANWTPDQWAGFTVNDTNTGRFSSILGNTKDTIFLSPPKDAAMVFNTGDGYTIYRVYVDLDQVGRSTGDLISGDNPTPVAWPHQVLEPLYVWNNTMDGVSMGANSGGYPNIQLGRDYYNGQTKPGYTPFTYPHPLTLSANPDRPAAPPNLRLSQQN